MAFKLKFQGKGKNPYGTMVNRGLITPALKPGPGDEKKTLQQKADDAAKASEKILLKPGDKGYDPTKAASYVQRGTASKETPFTDEGNAAYAAMSQAERDAQDKKWREIQSRNAEIFSYDDKPKEDPDPKPQIKAKPQQMGIYDFLKSKTFDVPLDLSKTVTKEQQSFPGGPIREYYAKEQMSDKEILDYLNSLGAEGGKILSQYREASQTNPGDALGNYSQYSSTGDDQRIKNVLEERKTEFN